MPGVPGTKVKSRFLIFFTSWSGGAVTSGVNDDPTSLRPKQSIAVLPYSPPKPACKLCQLEEAYSGIALWIQIREAKLGFYLLMDLSIDQYKRVDEIVEMFDSSLWVYLNISAKGEFHPVGIQLAEVKLPQLRVLITLRGIYRNPPFSFQIEFSPAAGQRLAGIDCISPAPACTTLVISEPAGDILINRSGFL